MKMEKTQASATRRSVLRAVSLLAGIAFIAAAGLGASAYFKKHREMVVIAWRLPSGAIFVEEDFEHPKLQRYLKKERLDEVVKPYKTDFARILALAKWTSQQFNASSPFPHYPPWDGALILDRIRRGRTGGFCAQYAFVFGQACQSVGYIPRYLDIASPENLGGHFTSEVYVPSLKRWIVFESEWGYYYVDTRGRPLSALELHDWATGKRRDPVFKSETHERVDPGWLRLFYFFRYYLRNNYLSVPVFVRRENSQMGFEPYRMIWSDAYTSRPEESNDAIPSSNPMDFEYAINSGSVPEIIWRKRGDFYKALTRQPLYQMCKLRMPYYALVRLVRNDFVHNPEYHRLKS